MARLYRCDSCGAMYPANRYGFRMKSGAQFVPACIKLCDKNGVEYERYDLCDACIRALLMLMQYKPQGGGEGWMQYTFYYDDLPQERATLLRLDGSALVDGYVQYLRENVEREAQKHVRVKLGKVDAWRRYHEEDMSLDDFEARRRGE